MDEDLKLQSYLESNNNKHRYEIDNLSRQYDLTPFLENESINLRLNVESQINTIQPNELEITLRIDNNQTTIEKSNFSSEFFDKGLFKDVYFDTQYTDIYFDKGVLEYISNVENIVKENDFIVIFDKFYDKNIDFFVGYAKDISFNRNQLYTEITFKIYDKSISGYEKRFENTENYYDYYVYNSNDKNRSLLHILAKKIMNDDNLINIEEIRYRDGSYIQIPFVQFEKDKKIIEELIECIKSVAGNLYINRKGIMNISSPLFQDDVEVINYTFNNSNTLTNIKKEVVKPIYNKTQVKYKEVNILERQPIFILWGKNGNYDLDNARVNIEPNLTKENAKYWKISFIDEIDGVSELEQTPEVEAYYLNDGGNEVATPLNYELELDTNGGKVKFWNTLQKEVIIKKFKIYGRPVKFFDESEVLFTEQHLQDHEINLLTIDNKYIQNDKLAGEIAKFNYWIECKEKIQLSFKANNYPVLEPLQVMNFLHKELDGQIQLREVNQYHDKLEIRALKYERYTPSLTSYETLKGTYLNPEELGKFTEIGKIIYPDDAPSTPINISVTSHFGGIEVSWSAVDRVDLKGYLVYVKSLDPTYILNKRIFHTGTSFIVKCEAGVEYEIKVSSITQAGVESPLSQALRATALVINADQINVDGDGITVDTTGKKIILGTVYANNISTNAVTTDKLMFSESDGLVKDANGNVKVIGDKLTITANTVFESNVQIKGQITGDTVFRDEVQINGMITGNSGITAMTDDKMTILKGGRITFLEKNGKGEFVESRIIRKIAADNYVYNPQAIEWIDLRNYSNGVAWTNTKIVGGIKDIVMNSSTKTVMSNIVRHPENDQLFYVEVGSSYVSQTSDWKFEGQMYTTASPDNFSKNVTIYNIKRFKLNVLIGDYTYQSGSASGNLMYTTLKGKCIAKYRYKTTTSSLYSDWYSIGTSEKDLDINNTGTLYDVEFNFIVYSKSNGYGGYGGYQIYSTTSSFQDVEGGQAYWYAVEQ